MAALSAVVFTMSWWLGLYLLARDPRKPVLVLAAIGLTSFAVVVALDAVRVLSAAHADLFSRIEIYLVAVPAVAWFAVLVELARPCDSWRSRAGEALLIAVVAAAVLAGAVLAGSVDGPLRAGHWVMFAVISVSAPGAQLAGTGLDGLRCRAARVGGGAVGFLRRGSGVTRRHAAVLRRDGRGGRTVRRPGADRSRRRRSGLLRADRADCAAVHQPGGGG